MYKKKEEKKVRRVKGNTERQVICQVCVQCVYTDVFAELAEAARAEGAKKASGEEEEQSGRLLQKLLDSVDNESGERGKDKKAQKAVHLVENLPLLPAKLVDLIQEGSFVDFFWFPVLEDGPSDGEYRSYREVIVKMEKTSSVVLHGKIRPEISGRRPPERRTYDGVRRRYTSR